MEFGTSTVESPQSPDHMELTLEGIEFGISESKNLHKNKPDLSLKTLASWRIENPTMI